MVKVLQYLQFILIGCRCILFFFQWTTLIGPSQKSNTFNAPQIYAFATNEVCGSVSFNPPIYKYKPALWAMRQIVVLLRISWMHVLWCIWGVCCPTSLLEQNFHSQFWSSPFLTEAFIKAWVIVVIHINQFNQGWCIRKFKFWG